jgi:DNA repair exonuclease SbcCD ATPase subunit
MIMDVLGVLIAFVGLILLLSILVTSLVQATQSTFRLRGRNLQKGLSVILSNLREDSSVNDSKKNAARVLMMADPTRTDHEKLEEYINSKRSWFFGPKVSAIDVDDLSRAIVDSGIQLTSKQIKKIEERFKQFERFSSKQFQFIIRIITVFWALVIAVYFQVSTPHLLKELSTNPELRTQYETLAVQRLDKSREAIEQFKGYDQLAETALQQLSESHPELTERLEEVSGIDSDKNDLVNELKVILTDWQGDKELVLQEYEGLLNSMYQEEKEKSLKIAGDSLSALGLYDIKGWPNGGFYCSGDNILGVLITAILLSFGAPFWFEQLQRLVGLRDALKSTTK